MQSANTYLLGNNLRTDLQNRTKKAERWLVGNPAHSTRQNPRRQESSTVAQSHRTAVQQSTPTAKMAETPAALDSALEATTSADARVPSAAADIEIIDVGSASSTYGVGLSCGALGQSLSPVTEQTAVGPGCSRPFSKPSPVACLSVIPCFFYVRSPCFARVCSRWYSVFHSLVIFRLFLKCLQQSTYLQI